MFKHKEYTSPRSLPLPIILPTTPLFRIQLDKRIDPHDSHTSLDRALQLPHLTHTGFQHARLNTVDDFPTSEIQTVVLIVLLAGDVLFGRRESIPVGDALGESVSGAELGN